MSEQSGSYGQLRTLPVATVEDYQRAIARILEAGPGAARILRRENPHIGTVPCGCGVCALVVAVEAYQLIQAQNRLGDRDGALQRCPRCGDVVCVHAAPEVPVLPSPCLRCVKLGEVVYLEWVLEPVPGIAVGSDGC